MSDVVEAWHIPGLEAHDLDGWHTLEYGNVTVRVPELGADRIAAIADRLRDSRSALVEVPIERVIEAIDEAAAALATDGDLRGVAERVLPATTRYHPTMARLVLDRMTEDWRQDALERLVQTELGDRTLDDFTEGPGPGRRRLAHGPELLFHVFAGNVPGVAVTSLVRALLVRSASLAKTARDEPMLPVLFARALAAAEPALGDCIAVCWWPAADEAIARAATDVADAVVVYGGETTARAMRRMAPPSKPFILHGPKLSFGIVGREALSADRVEATAAAVARATAIFDQHGCVSPHVVYVESDGETGSMDFAEAVSAALEALEVELPRGTLTTEEAAAIRQFRGAAEFRELAGGEVRVFAGAGTTHTVVHDADPTFTPSCLNRMLWVRRIGDAMDAARHVEPFADVLQSAAVEGLGDRTERVARALAHAGVSRITDFERLPWPAPHALHDGRGPLRELLRWTEIEK